jgi:hypothetical protein
MTRVLVLLACGALAVALLQAPPAAAQRAPRGWVWIQMEGTRYLAFAYVDPMAGPSAKGGPVAATAGPEEVRRAIEAPTGTFRLPGIRVRPLRRAEIRRLRLPARPAWMEVFDELAASMQRDAVPPGPTGAVAGVIRRGGALCPGWIRVVATGEGTVTRSGGAEDDGAFLIDGLPPGRYRLEARAEPGRDRNGPELQREVTIAAGVTERVDLDFAIGATVIVRVTGLPERSEGPGPILLLARGADAATRGADALLRDHSNRFARTTRSAGGAVSAELIDVATGTYAACAIVRDGGPGTARCALVMVGAPGTTVMVEMPLHPAAAP